MSISFSGYYFYYCYHLPVIVYIMLVVCISTSFGAAKAATRVVVPTAVVRPRAAFAFHRHSTTTTTTAAAGAVARRRLRMLSSTSSSSSRTYCPSRTICFMGSPPIRRGSVPPPQLSQQRRLPWHRTFATSSLDVAGFSLWSAVASAVDENVVLPPPQYTLQVKACVSNTKQDEGVAIGFYCFESGSLDAQQQQQPQHCHTNLGGCAYFRLNRSTFEAYYSAIYSSLDYIIRQPPQQQLQQGGGGRTTTRPIRSVLVQCDHDIVVHQLNDVYEIQRPSLRALYWKVMELKEEHFEDVRFECIPSSEITKAGEYAMKALGSKDLITNQNHIQFVTMEDPMAPTSFRADSHRRPNKSISDDVDALDSSSPTTIEKQSTTTGSRITEAALNALRSQNRDRMRADYSFPAKPRGHVEEEEEDSLASSSDGQDSNAVDNGKAQIDESNNNNNTAPISHNVPTIFPDHLYILEFDGGSRENPSGVAGAGMVLYDTRGSGQDKQEIWVGWDYLGYGQNTNNQAEYTGLIRGLEVALARGVRKIAVYGDSNLIIKQITGEYRVRNEKLIPLWKQTKELLEKFDSYSVHHIRRHLNSRADSLANLAMDREESGSSD